MADSGFNATIFPQVSCALGVVAGGALADRLSRRTPAARFYVAAAGILLFSGSLYAMALTGVRILGAVTPVGGLALLAGWLLLLRPSPGSR